MSVYQLKILTPDKKIFDDTVVSITVSGENGQLTVLARHAPMVAVLVKGPIVIRTEKETLEGETGRGMLQVGRNEAAVLVHSFRWNGDRNKDKDTAEEVPTHDMM